MTLPIAWPRLALLLAGFLALLADRRACADEPDNRTVIAVEFNATALKGPFFAAQATIKSELEKLVIAKLTSRYPPIRWEVPTPGLKPGGVLRFTLLMKPLLSQFEVKHECVLELKDEDPRKLSFANDTYDLGGRVPTKAEAAAKLLEAADKLFETRIPQVSSADDKWSEHCFVQVPLAEKFSIDKPWLVVHVALQKIRAANESKIVVDLKAPLRSGSITVLPVSDPTLENAARCEVREYVISQLKGSGIDEPIEALIRDKTSYRIRMAHYVRDYTKKTSENPDERD